MKLLPLSLAAFLFAPLAHAAELTGTLRKIADSGVITLGVREHTIPFSYVVNGENVGYAFDICMRVVNAVKRDLNLPGLQVRTRLVTTADRIALVKDGTIDLECSTATNNVDRQRQVAFSNTFFLSASRFASKRSDRLNSIESLRGRSVSSTSGTTNLTQLNQLNLALGLNITVLDVPDSAKAFGMIAAGNADAFVMDDVQLSAFIAASDGPSYYTLSKDALSAAEPYGLLLRRDDPDFKALVDRATAELFQSQEGPALYARWFETPIPPNGLNLQLPMSAALRHAFQHPSANADPASYVTQ